MIQNAAAIVYLGVFFSLLYMVKNILDSERILDNHPYFRSGLLRVFLIIDVASPLALILKPEYSDWVHLVMAIGLMGTFTLIAIIYNRHLVKVKITLTNNSESVVSAEQYLSFQSDKYTQLAPGIFTRRVTGPNNIINANAEGYLREHLAKFDYTNKVVLIVRFKVDSEFSEHIHPGWEEYYLVLGKVQMTKSLFMETGDSYKMPPKKPHFFKALADGVILVALDKEMR